MNNVTRRSTSPIHGLLFMASGMFLFSMVDTIAKFLTNDFHPIQVMWSRQTGLVIGVLILVAIKGFSIFHTNRPFLQVTRGIAAAGSGILFIFAIVYVPLADAVAVSFVAPFLVTVMGAIFLGEKVGIRRWTAISIGFLATLLIIRPGLGVVHPAAFLVVLAASLFALRQILSRALIADSVTTTVAFTALVSGAFLTIPLPFVWQTPQWGLDLVLLSALAILAAIAEICVIKALSMAEAVILAPVHYTLIIWGTLYGFYIFGDFPDIWTWVGAIIITLSGIYTVYREHVVSKQKKLETAESS